MARPKSEPLQVVPPSAKTSSWLPLPVNWHLSKCQLQDVCTSSISLKLAQQETLISVIFRAILTWHKQWQSILSNNVKYNFVDMYGPMWDCCATALESCFQGIHQTYITIPFGLKTMDADGRTRFIVNYAWPYVSGPVALSAHALPT